MSGLTKLGLALILVFVFLLLAFVAELVYLVLFRRRSHRAPLGVDDPEMTATVVGGDEPSGSPKSKELLLYLLCWKNQSRIEPTSAAATPEYSVAAAAAAPGFPHPGPAASNSKALPLAPPSAAQPSAEAVDEELAKWRAFYASRVLFTIREEEKEGAESDGGSARLVVGRFHVVGERATDEEVNEAVPSDSQVAATAAKHEEEEKDVVEVATAFHQTPFSTPCASPPFYTPPPSPPRGLDAGAEMKIPPDTDAPDGEAFSPAEEKLAAGINPRKGADATRRGAVSIAPASGAACAGP